MVSAVNFVLTFEGLSQQLLEQVLKFENEKLDDECNKIASSRVEASRKLNEIETKIF